MALSFLKDRDENTALGNLGVYTGGGARGQSVEVNTSVLNVAARFAPLTQRCRRPRVVRQKNAGAYVASYTLDFEQRSRAGGQKHERSS